MSVDKQGQGPNTLRKAEGLRHLFRTGLCMMKNQPYPYWHLDMHAGSGWNDDADCLGSPLVFIEEAIRAGKDFNALFCDRNRDAIELLRARTFFAVEQTLGSTLSVVCKDNAEALKDFAVWIASEESRLACGSVLIDPNGFNPRDVPLEALKAFFAIHERIDIILNVNLSLFAMVRRCKGNPNTPGFDDWPDPVDVLGLKPLKKHWLVRNPSRGGRYNRFTLFLGRTHDAAMNGFKDFYPLESERGQLIVRHLIRVDPEQLLLWEE